MGYGVGSISSPENTSQNGPAGTFFLTQDTICSKSNRGPGEGTDIFSAALRPICQALMSQQTSRSWRKRCLSPCRPENENRKPWNKLQQNIHTPPHHLRYRMQHIPEIGPPP